MKVKYFRHHKVQPVQYESLDFGVTIEVDTEVDTEYADMTIDQIRDDLDAMMDVALDTAVNRALKLGGQMDESHVWDYYEKD